MSTIKDEMIRIKEELNKGKYNLARVVFKRYGGTSPMNYGGVEYHLNVDRDGTTELIKAIDVSNPKTYGEPPITRNMNMSLDDVFKVLVIDGIYSRLDVNYKFYQK